MMNKMMKRTAIVAMAAMMAVMPTLGVCTAHAADNSEGTFKLVEAEPGSMKELCVRTAARLQEMDAEEMEDYLAEMQADIQLFPIEDQIVIVKGIPALIGVMNGEESMEDMCMELNDSIAEAQKAKEEKEEDGVILASDDEAWKVFEENVKEMANYSELEVIFAVDTFAFVVEEADIPVEIHDMILATVQDVEEAYDLYLNPVVVETVSYKAYCAADSLNVRPSADTDGAPIGMLTKNQEVQVTGKVSKAGVDTGWVQISFNGQNGYVSAQYMTQTAPKKEEKKEEKKDEKKENKVEKKFTLIDESGAEITLKKYTDGTVKTEKGDLCKKIQKGEWKNKKSGEVYLSKEKWDKNHTIVIDNPVVAPIYNHEYDFKLFGDKDGKKEFVMHKLPNGDVINDTYEDLKEVKDNKGIWQNVKTKEYFAEKKGDERLIKLIEEQNAAEQTEKEAAEKAAKEAAEKEAAEKVAKEQAEKEAAERAAKEAAEKEAAEKAAREQAEKEAAEKAAKEQAEKEAAEKAAKEQAEKEAAEKAAKEQAEKEAAEQAAKEAAEKEVAEQAE